MSMPPLIARTLWAAVYVSSMLLGSIGCVVGPDFTQPQVRPPGQWSELPSSGASTDMAEVIDWWKLFNDAELNSLIKRAVAANLDLKLAGARILEARALRGMVVADLYPKVDASGSYSRLRSSGTATPIVGGGDAAEFAAASEKNLFEAGFDAAWEADIFGRLRRKVQAADAELAAAEWDRRDVLVVLLSEVARNYVELRGAQKRITILKENIELQQQSLELTRGRLEAGLGNELDVAQAEALLTTTEAQIPALDAAVKTAIHRLGVLLALGPEALLQELAAETPIPPAPPLVPVGLPSELLRRRPDIRKSEMQLAAATARVGVATADLFPTFSLTGLLGLGSAKLEYFARPDSLMWNVGPTISWPVFDAGRIRANIKVQDAREEQALLSYHKTVLKSFEDVENALVAYATEQQTRRSLMAVVDANRRAADISSALYSEGLVDFLNVLVSQRALSQSQDELVQSDQRVSTDLVALFKALGGGWQTGG